MIVDGEVITTSLWAQGVQNVGAGDTGVIHVMTDVVPSGKQLRGCGVQTSWSS